MEADWEVEIGGQAPVIDACWEGFVDLRVSPGRVLLLAETRELPVLGEILIELNSASSPVWTAKCDVWTPAEFDPDELDAQPDDGKCALACYIDLLPKADRPWTSPEQAVAVCRAICESLRRVSLRSCRADLIMRQAHVSPDRQDQGITAYVTACGPTPAGARAALTSALRIFADSVPHSGTASTLQ